MMLGVRSLSLFSSVNGASVRRQAGVVLMGTIVSTAFVPFNSSTHCENDKNNKSFVDVLLPKDAKTGSIEWSKCASQLNDNVFWDELASVAGKNVQNVIDSGVPTQLSYGFISGYCSGFALKKAGKVVAVVFGLGFMSLQTLQYYGYIQVDQSRIQKDVESALDLNEDGKIDSADGKLALEGIMGVLQYNMPAGSGFAAGFVGGLRSG